MGGRGQLSLHSRATLERLAAQAPRTLACMLGSARRGDAGALLLRDLAGCLAAARRT
jgi:hypothetical protein